MRRFASKIFNLMVRLILKSPFSDHQCGFKAISKEKFNLILPLLRENGWFLILNLSLLLWFVVLELSQLILFGETRVAPKYLF